MDLSEQSHWSGGPAMGRLYPGIRGTNFLEF